MVSFLQISGSKLVFAAGFILITVLILPYTSDAITLLNDDAQKYVDNVIKQFEEDSQRFNHCPIVYPPLPPPGSPKEDYFRPKLMLWSPQEEFGIVIQCPLHGHELRPYQWTSDISGKGGEMARLVYDLMENVILIQRIYLCSNGRRRHWMRATTPDIHTALPSHIQESFPAVIFQRCSFTKTVVHYIDTEVERGVNLNLAWVGREFEPEVPSLFSYFNHFLAAQGSDKPFFSRERGSYYA